MDEFCDEPLPPRVKQFALPLPVCRIHARGENRRVRSGRRVSGTLRPPMPGGKPGVDPPGQTFSTVRRGAHSICNVIETSQTRLAALYAPYTHRHQRPALEILMIVPLTRSAGQPIRASALTGAKNRCRAPDANRRRSTPPISHTNDASIVNQQIHADVKLDGATAFRSSSAEVRSAAKKLSHPPRPASPRNGIT